MLVISTVVLVLAFTRVNECETGDHTCNITTNHVCVDRFMGFSCECNDGYVGNDRQCFNVDECAVGLHNCHVYADCTDIEGSYECTCNEISNGTGFDCECIDGYNATEFECVNIDECLNDIHDCHEYTDCTDNEGSYDCKCKDGYVYDGQMCKLFCFLIVIRS